VYISQECHKPIQMEALLVSRTAALLRNELPGAETDHAQAR